MPATFLSTGAVISQPLTGTRKGRVMTAWRTGMAYNPPTSNPASLAELSQRTRPALLRYFIRRGLTHLDAEDAVQDVFVRLSRSPDLATLEHAEAYLFKTAASVAIDRHRSVVAKYERGHIAYDESLHAVADHSVERIVEGRQELSRLIASLEQLPERTRNVVVLARLERMSHIEIARRLGISISTVERRLAKGMAYLATRLGEAEQ